AGTSTHDVEGAVTASGSGGLALTSTAAGRNHQFISGTNLTVGSLPNLTVNVSGAGSSVTIGDGAGDDDGPAVVAGSITVTAGAVNIFSPVGNTTSTGITGSVTNNGAGAVTIDPSGTVAGATLRIGGSV